MPDETEPTATLLSQSVELALTHQPDAPNRWGAGRIRPERVVFCYLDDRTNAHLYGLWVREDGEVTDAPVDQLYRHDDDWPDWLRGLAAKHNPREKPDIAWTPDVLEAFWAAAKHASEKPAADPPVPELTFRPADEPHPDAEDFVYDTCRCPNPDDQYTLEIDASSVYLTHNACGRHVGEWAQDALQLPKTPVTLTWTVNGDSYTGEVEDAWADLTINAPATALTPCTCRQAVHAKEHTNRPVDRCTWCMPAPNIRPNPPKPAIQAVDARLLNANPET